MLIDAHARLDEYAGPLDVLDGFIRLGAYFTGGVEGFTSPHIQEIARRDTVAANWARLVGSDPAPAVGDP